MFAIGMDLGGTNIRAGLVDKSGKILDYLTRPSPAQSGPEATTRFMAEIILELKKKSPGPLSGVGIGSPGPLSRSEKKIFQTPNLAGFENFPLGSRVEALCALPVELDNDAKCATYGEGLFGSARGLNNYILLTFGTGLGAGVIVDNQMIYGKSDGACEIGHMTLHPEGLPCNCSNKGCFEQYCSASAVERRASQNAGRKISGVELFDEFSKGQEWAEKTLRAVALDLSYACASLVNIFDPQAIVFGGGLFTEGGGPLCEWVREGIRERCFESSRKNLKIIPSSLKGEAGILGAASLVLRKA